MNNKLTSRQRKHLATIKQMDCAVCGQPGPSDAHHIEQHKQYLCVPLCKDCHTGTNGWHGTKNLWRIRKMDELDALNDTLAKLL